MHSKARNDDKYRNVRNRDKIIDESLLRYFFQQLFQNITGARGMSSNVLHIAVDAVLF